MVACGRRLLTNTLFGNADLAGQEDLALKMKARLGVTRWAFLRRFLQRPHVSPPVHKHVVASDEASLLTGEKGCCGAEASA